MTLALGISSLYLWHHFALTIAAALTTLFTLLFFGSFFFGYVVDALYADANPWINEVERMDWGMNPLYMPWLFENDMRSWSFYMTAISAVISPVIGFSLLNALTGEKWTCMMR
jgi:hypothetical protein